MEKISREDQDEDAWVCICGNNPDSDGFYPCNANGEEMEPDIGSDWDGLYVCSRCGRIIDEKDLSVVGHRKKQDADASR